MPDTHVHHRFLVVRPWLATTEPGFAYAHFDALVMRPIEWPLYRYGALDLPSPEEMGPNRIFLRGFRISCQIDNRHRDAYAWTWGYQPSDGGLFTADDYRHYGKSLAAIAHRMTRLDAQHGRAATIGEYVLRLARILDLAGVALLPISANGGFTASSLITRLFTHPCRPEATQAIDHLTLELHEACADRAHRRRA